MPQNKKGARRERELCKLLDETYGFAVIRGPASGSRTDRELPDVFAGKNGSLFAIELKASGGDPIYVQEREVEELRYFADHFGATPLIGVRFDAKNGDPEWGSDGLYGFYFFDPDELYRTDGGNYRVRKEDRLDGMVPAELAAA